MAANLQIVEGKHTIELAAGVGFSYLPNWRMSKARHEEHQLNILVLGKENTGKATLINSLFNAKLIAQDAVCDSVLAKGPYRFVSYQKVLTENGISVCVRVTVVEGYGSLAAKTESQHIVDYLACRFEERLQKELSQVQDFNPDKHTIPVTLMLASPYGQGFSKWELELARKLQQFSLLLPIIPKADTFTLSELGILKQEINSQWNHYGLFSIANLLDQSEEAWLVDEFNSIFGQLPLSIVASYDPTLSADQSRTRAYPWGTVQLDKCPHNNSQLVQKLLINKFFVKIKKFAMTTLYENYRKRFLSTSKDVSVTESIRSLQPSVAGEIPRNPIRASSLEPVVSFKQSDNRNLETSQSIESYNQLSSNYSVKAARDLFETKLNL